MYSVVERSFFVLRLTLAYCTYTVPAEDFGAGKGVSEGGGTEEGE